MVDKKSVSVESPYVRYKTLADNDITMRIFEIIERSPEVSQRKITIQTGLASGLVHSFMRRVINKGWVRAKQVSAKRWLYFLTSDGFTEKSRLTIDYFSRTFTNYRQAQALIKAHLEHCLEKGWRRLVVAGQNELAEIASLNIKANDELNLVAILGAGKLREEDDWGEISPYESILDLEYDRILICDVRFLRWLDKNNGAIKHDSVLLISNIE